MKPGYLTSECWITVGVLVAGLAVQLGFVNAADVGGLTDGWSKTVTAIFTLGAQAAAALAYLRSRHALKAASAKQAPSGSVLP